MKRWSDASTATSGEHRFQRRDRRRAAGDARCDQRLDHALTSKELHRRNHDRDYRRVQDGCKALVRVDAFPGRVFQGRVQKLAPRCFTGGEPLDEVATCQATIGMDQPTEHLQPHMSAEAVIFADGSSASVLVAPLQAILWSPAMGDRAKCIVRTSRGLEERTVRLGKHDDRLVEILSGLVEGETIVLQPKKRGERGRRKEAAANKRRFDNGQSPETQERLKQQGLTLENKASDPAVLDALDYLRPMGNASAANGIFTPLFTSSAP